MKDKLINIIKKAYSSVPLYMKLAERNNIDVKNIKELNQLPLVEKAMYLEDPEAGIASEYILRYVNGDLIYMDTSGSAGKCLRTFWQEADINQSMVSQWIARKKRYDINSASKMCYFYTMTGAINEQEENGIKYQRTNKSLGFSKLNLSKEKIITIYNMIREFQPEWMFLQTSMAMLLISILRQENLERIDSLKYIELTGEILKNYERERIKEYFRCNVANLYGCNEMNSIAYECPEGNLHCMGSNVFVEIIKNGKRVEAGEEGDIYLTSLNNKVMPFVRYGIGDRGKIKKVNDCKCGNRNPILILTNARKNDFVLYSDGTKTTAEIFVNIFLRINKQINVVMQFQVIQRDYDNFLIKIVLNEDLMEDEELDEKDIKDMFYINLEEDKLADANFVFEFSAELFPDNSTGKLKYFECKIK